MDALAYWNLLPSLAAFVCAPPKCGSSTLAIRVFGAESVGDLQRRGGSFAAWQLGAPTALPRYLAVRDPVERFASLWRNKSRNGPTARSAPEVHGMSPEELLEHVRRYPFGNVHWFPQVAYYARGTEPLTMGAFFAKLGVDGPPLNRTAKAPTDPPMPADAIRAVYAADVELWRYACSRS